MSWSKKVGNYLFSSRIKRNDFILALLSLMLLAFLMKFGMSFGEIFTSETSIELGYNAKQGLDGLMYVIDEGHERLICFDESGQIKFSLDNPTDEEGEILYIDDFSLADKGIYISASVWDEMALSKEEILLYDYNGKYISTVDWFEYDDYYTNKHRLYGISDNNGEPRYIECLDDSIMVDGVNIDYGNALNAISDAAFYGDELYILDKSGKIVIYGNGKEGTVIYDTAWEKNENIVPYKLAVDKYGNIYFTDIRNKTVRMVDSKEQKSSVIYNNTDSLTVNITNNNGIMVLDDNGFHIVGDDGEEVYLVLKKNTEALIKQVLVAIACVAFGICVILLVVRLLYFLIKRKYSRTQIVSIWVVSAVVVVSALLCGMLMNSFSISYREKIEEQVKCAAYMVANQISGNDIENVDATGFGSGAYNRLCEVMESSFTMNIDFYRKLYCNILRLSDDGSEGYAVAYLDQSVGAYFPLDDVEKSELDAVYDTGKEVWNEEVEDISGTYLSIKVPVYNDGGNVCGAVAVGVETYIITDTIRELFVRILMSVIILLMLVWLVSVEVMSFANNYDIYKRSVAQGGKNVMPGHFIRLLVFLVFAAYNMTATFLPVYLLRKVDFFPDNMQEFMGALPITVNIFVIGLMSLFCANLLKKFGIRKIMVLTVMCSFAGNFMIYMTSNYYGALIGLALDGIGVGLITNTVYVMLTYIKNEADRTWGLTIYNGAFLSGVNFGMIFGSFLAVMVNQRFVFLVVAITWLILLGLTGFMMTTIEKLIEVPRQQETNENKKDKGVSTWKFLCNKTIMGFIVLIQNPYIVFGSFIFYYVPIFCDKLGYGETICSVLIMIYSEVAVLGTDKLTEVFTKLFKNYSMYISLAMNIVALLIFALSPGIVSMIIALLIMGIAAAYGKPIQQNYYLKLENVKKYGEDRSIGIYNFTENIGESLGPVVFGGIMETSALKSSVGMFGIVIAGMGFVHYIMERKELKGDGR